jgi:hypothetical protein
MQQIAEWLEKLGMSEYAERFTENGISVAALRHLTDQDLKDIGVLLGHRRIMLAAIGDLAGAPPGVPKPVAAAEPKAQDAAERRQGAGRSLRPLAGLARAKELGISLGRRRLEDSDKARVTAIKRALAAKQGVLRIARDLKTGVGTVLRTQTRPGCPPRRRAALQGSDRRCGSWSAMWYRFRPIPRQSNRWRNESWPFDLDDVKSSTSYRNLRNAPAGSMVGEEERAAFDDDDTEDVTRRRCSAPPDSVSGNGQAAAAASRA